MLRSILEIESAVPHDKPAHRGHASCAAKTACLFLAPDGTFEVCRAYPLEASRVQIVVPHETFGGLELGCVLVTQIARDARLMLETEQVGSPPGEEVKLFLTRRRKS
jgi:hypothetical protein